VRFLFSRYFLVQFWTLSGLLSPWAGSSPCFGAGAARGPVDLFPIVIDFTDGTLARRFRIKEKVPLVAGEALDMITDVIR
jgi:phosphatidylglycerophosphate synthase